jgi:hypothetical protein
MKCTLQKEMRIVTYEGGRERATSADDSRCVSNGVQKCSVQYKEYNLIGVTAVEGGTTRGMTALFITEYIAAYIQVLYKGDALHLTSLTVNQGCRQLSTGSTLFSISAKSIMLLSIPLF